MTIIDNLNSLQNKIASAKQTLATNLTEKGVAVTTANTLSEMATAVTTIPSGGGGGGNQPFDFAAIGYTGEEEPIKSNIAYSKEILDTWDTSQTNLDKKFKDNKQLVYMPLVDTSSATSVISMFEGCSELQTIPSLNMSKVTDMSSFAKGCTKLYSFPKIDLSNVKSMTKVLESSGIKNIDFRNAKNVEIYQDAFNSNYEIKTAKINLSSAINTLRIFNNCRHLQSIHFFGNPSKITVMDGMFGSAAWYGMATNGTLIYDYRYDYSKIIEELHRNNETWTAKSSYEPQECTSLSITADDTAGNSTTTTVHYTAMTNGINILTNERVENVEVKGDATSEPFGENPSYDTSRQVTVTFNYLGQTATTTITQGVKLPPTVTVDLMSNWELAPTETIPNPNPTLYEGVYQSVHKGQGNVMDKMVITFIAMPNFELYIRSNAESNYDYMYCGKLDESEPTEYASTKGKQNAGTALENYIKVEYPNDGGEHSITVVYRKDSSGDSGDDRGYIFFTKPQE